MPFGRLSCMISAWNHASIPSKGDDVVDATQADIDAFAR